jgi:hypothetical protein
MIEPATQLHMYKLPALYRHGMYHPDIGFISSPQTQNLPAVVADGVTPSEAGDYDLPCALADDNIYLVCYPREELYDRNCHIVEVISIHDDQLPHYIDVVDGGMGFALAEHTIRRWIDLEDTLISIIGTLMGSHKDAHLFPLVAWPHWPQSFGYRKVYSDPQTAFNHALHSKQAFPMTSTAALYTTETRIQRIQGSHKTTPFDRSADARSFRRSYIVAQRSSIDFADHQPRTGRPTDRYPLNKLIPFLSIRYRPTSE